MSPDLKRKLGLGGLAIAGVAGTAYVTHQVDRRGPANPNTANVGNVNNGASTGPSLSPDAQALKCAIKGASENMFVYNRLNDGATKQAVDLELDRNDPDLSYTVALDFKAADLGLTMQDYVNSGAVVIQPGNGYLGEVRVVFTMSGGTLQTKGNVLDGDRHSNYCLTAEELAADSLQHAQSSGTRVDGVTGRDNLLTINLGDIHTAEERFKDNPAMVKFFRAWIAAQSAPAAPAEMGIRDYI